MKESQSQSSIKKTSIFNALIIYGVVPVLIFVAFAFMDETYTLGLLDAYRVPAPAPSPSLVPKPPPLNSEQQQHQQQQNLWPHRQNQIGHQPHRLNHYQHREWFVFS
mmetsp:Transcript_19333/g.28590  ORF Transcript_19333/g.28590 Transcript_19333/m.28590 type:complete len:107 (+) Transcript_19333:36-356(+)